MAINRTGVLGSCRLHAKFEPSLDVLELSILARLIDGPGEVGNERTGWALRCRVHAEDMQAPDHHRPQWRMRLRGRQDAHLHKISATGECLAYVIGFDDDRIHGHCRHLSSRGTGRTNGATGPVSCDGLPYESCQASSRWGDVRIEID